MRDRMEKAIGALLIARLGRRECATLDGLLASWDGRFTLDVRSRVTRHVESCPVCTRGRLQLATYQRLAPAVLPVFLVPELLRDKVLGSVALVSQQLAVGGGSGAGGQVDPWSWHDDGFPQPRPSRPLEVGPEGDDAAAGGATAGATLAAGTGAALLAAGLGGHPPQPVVDPWTLPAGPGGPPGPSPPPPGAPAPGPHRMPGQRRGVRTPLLVVAAIVLLLGGGIGTWKVASASPDPAASAAGSGAGSTLGTGDGPTGPTSTTIDPTTAMTTTGTATTSLTPTTSAPTRSSPTTATSTTTTATTAAAAAHLGVSASGLAFGKQTSATVTTRTVTLTNDGGQKLSWTASVTGAGFAVTAGSGTLGPGTSATVTVTLNRSGLAEGAVSGSLALHASPTGQAFAVALTGTVANPPVISIDSFSSPLAYSGAPATGSCTSQTGGLKATVTDDSGPNGVVSVTVSWTDGKATTTKALNQDGTPWYGSYGPFATMTSYRLTVSAKDVQGNVGTAGFTVSVQRC
jgi:hypothetical protein